MGSVWHSHKYTLDLCPDCQEEAIKNMPRIRAVGGGKMTNIYALARARTQESIERVEKKRKRTKDTYTPEAYEEHKAQCRENARKRAHDPKVIEAHRKTSHDWYEAHKHDPEFIKRRKEAQARYRAKVAADPVKNSARKEYMHDYCAKRYAKQKAELESWK